jgi:DNA-binding IclR family transcriptional regulator
MAAGISGATDAPHSTTGPTEEAADGLGGGSDEDFRPVKSAARVLEVLEALAAEGPLNLRDLAAHLQVPKSSMHALLRTMQWRGWLETDATGTLYGLGVRSLLAGSAYVDGDAVVRQTGPVLDQLAQQTGETVHLGRLEGSDVVYLAKRESSHPLRLFSSVGRRLPAHSVALGKALLAEMSPDEALDCLPARLPAVAPRTITDRGRLLEELAQVRRVGYAIDDEESAADLRCFGVALRQRSGTRDAISISVPVVRLTEGRQEEIVELLLRARASFSY